MSAIQLQTSYLATPDTNSIIIFLTVLGIIVLLVILGNILSKRARTGGSSDKKYNRFIFERMAKDVGFRKDHIETLRKLVAISGIRHPQLLFTNPGLLDSVLKKGIYSIERQTSLPEDERIRLLNTVYEIKQTLEFHAKQGIGIKSTLLIKPGQALILHLSNTDRYQTKLITNQSSGLVCSYPMIPHEREHLIKRGANIKVTLWRENDSGYAFPSKILGYDLTHSVPSITLQHSSKIVREQHRKSNRKPLQKSCFLYPVELVHEGPKKHQRTKLVARDSNRHVGVVMDISAGGCRIGSTTPFEKGSYIKVEFDIKQKAPVAALGKIQTVKRRTGVNNIILHVKFVKLSSRSRNNIYSYVYNYI